MPLSLERRLLRRLDLDAAVAAELEYQPPYLPPSSLGPALEGRDREVVRVLTGGYQQSPEPEEAEVVQVEKRGGGIRPVAVVDFSSRVLYRALSSIVEPELPILDRTFPRRSESQEAPFADPANQYVVLSDVAAFYDFVDHGRLVQEIVAQTGEAEIAEAIAELLEAVMGRRFGLPQVLHPSDVLSEAYVDIAERTLLREGLSVTRYNDDFWIATSTWSAARDALYALDRAVRDIGLTLNEVKTLTLTRGHYEAWLREPERRWQALNESVEFDLRSVGAYEEEDESEEIEPDQADVVVGAATSALELGLEEVPADRLQAEVNRQLVAAAVSALQFWGSEGGLPYVTQILGREPHLTSRIARYLAAIAPDREPVVALACEDAVAKVHLSEWQAMWLFEPLRRLPALSQSLRTWVSSFTTPQHGDLVRARAAIVLGEKGLVDPELLAELYGSASSAARPDIVWAIARRLPDSDSLVRAIRRDGPLNQWVIAAARA